MLGTLQQAGTELSPGEVRARLDDELAYTTVMTVLTRLYDKGLVSRRPVGRGYAYAAVTDRSSVTARRMRELLDTDVDRAGVLARFVDTLSPQDERLLRELLEEEGEST